MNGCQTIISTIGQRKDEPLVSGAATLNILHAMGKLNMKRYIAVAGLNIDTPFDKKGVETSAATKWMSTNFPDIQADRQKAYSILASSNTDWTLIRVPFIEFTEVEGTVAADLKDCPGKKITAQDIAIFIVQQLTDNRYLREAPFIANV
jgi:hypothetical protein